MSEVKIPEGYKQTEIGIIPEDWIVSNIVDLTSNIVDYRGRTPKKLGMNWGDGDIVALSAGNVKKGYIDFNTDCYLGSEALYNRWMTSGHPQKNDIIFTLEAPLGNTALIPDSKKYILSQRVILLQVNRLNFKPEYIFQVFLSSSFMSYIVNSATGSTAQGIKRKTFEKLTIALPPTMEEQTAIANALTDTDNLIQSLEKLIAKKEAIKTGTMQQLLTGKTRLPEFATREDGSAKGFKQTELGRIPEDWEVFKLNENFQIFAGGDAPRDSLSKTKTESCPHPIYANAIQNHGLYGYTSYKRAKPDSITITARGYLGHAEYRNEHFFPIVRLLVLEPIGLMDSKYTTYAINSLMEFSIESTGVPQLTAPQVGRYGVIAPLNKEEQTAIATILSDMDAEIEALQDRLEKTKSIKEGMMQQLLTGKVRLV